MKKVIVYSYFLSYDKQYPLHFNPNKQFLREVAACHIFVSRKEDVGEGLRG